MPNNIVFNNVANQLQTQIYGQEGSNVRPVQTDASGNLIVTGTVTALVATVTAVVASGTITALLSTVTAVVQSGTVTALLSTVTAVALPQFTETSTTVAQIVSQTIPALTADTSAQRMYSFYVANTSAASLTAFLQISPTTAETYFVNDASSAFVLAGAARAVLVAQKYLRYTRLMLQAGADTASAIAYYNGQS